MSYILTNSGDIINGINYNKYVLKPSGMSVTIIENPSPIISGDVVVRTLTNTNQGLPHTLEHLIFLGSKSYQKGFLDLAANQCIAQGTNAWTSQDSTVYSVKCGSLSGFLKFLPIFLDHILFPVLLEDAFYTEIYHVTGEGDDAGVVYCEMQAFENTDNCLADKALASSIFPGTHVYSVETGGLMSELRNISVNDCRGYHAANYTAANLNIIITGNVEIDEVVSTLDSFLSKLPTEFQPIMAKEFSLMNFLPISDNSGSHKEVEICFPSQDYGDPGIVKLGIIGAALSDRISMHAEEILIEYFISTPVSPLYAELVHSVSPLCSDISFERLFYPQTVIVLSFTGTVDERYPEIKNKIVSVLNTTSIDIKRIRDLVRQKIAKLSYDVETNCFDKIHSIFTYHHLYQSLFSDNLLDSLKFGELFRDLLSRDAAFWESMLMVLAGNIRSIVRASPNPEVMQQLEVERQHRKKLFLSDCSDLEKLNIKLDRALAINNETINYKSILELEDITVSLPKSLNYKKLSQGLYFHTIKSKFLTIFVMKESYYLSSYEKSCLQLISKLFGDLPTTDGCSRTEINGCFEKYFLHHSLHARGLYGDQIVYSFTFEEKNLSKCLDLIEQVISKNTVLQSIVEDNIQALLLDVSSNERCGYETMVSLIDELMFPGSVAAMASLNNQRVFLQKTQSNISHFCSDLQELFDKLSKSPSCIHVSGASDSECVSLISDRFDTSDSISFTKPHRYSSSVGDTISIVEVPGEETSYLSLLLLHVSDDITFHLQMSVFSAWFGQLDGVVGREIRGKGLGYHFFTKYSHDGGCIMLQVQMSNDIAGAYHATHGIISKIVKEHQDIINEDQIVLAKRSVMYTLVHAVGNPHKAVDKQIKEIHDPILSLSHDEIHQILEGISLNDIIKLCSDYIIKLFDLAEVHKMIVTCPPGKVSLSDFELIPS